MGKFNVLALTPHLTVWVGVRGVGIKTTPHTVRESGDLQGADGGSLPRRAPPAVMTWGSCEPPLGAQ